MDALPCTIQGNIKATSGLIRHRAAQFETTVKLPRYRYQKSLQLERRFSHYEQIITGAPIERCSKNVPRRLQTRKLSRPVDPIHEEERIKWNERLAAWLREDKTSTVEYIKFSEQFNVIRKQLYYCSACHEFFHLNLHERENGRIGCPRFRNHHGDHVRPVSMKKVKKPPRKRPPLIARDPFSDRGKSKIRSLMPAKPFKPKVAVPLPPIPRSIPPPPAPSQVSSRKPQESPINSSPGKSSINRSSSRSQSKLTTTSVIEGSNSPGPPTPKDVDPTNVTSPSNVTKATNPSDATAMNHENTMKESLTPPADSSSSLASPSNKNHPEGSSPSLENLLDLHGMSESSDVVERTNEKSMDHESKEKSPLIDKSAQLPDLSIHQKSQEHKNIDDKSEVDHFISEDLQSLNKTAGKTSTLARKEKSLPVPPDLPEIQFRESPDSPTIKTTKRPMKRRQAIILPAVNKGETKSKTSPPQKLREARKGNYNYIDRMNKKKKLHRFRGHNESSSDEYISEDPERIDDYTDSFLEKYCLVSPEQLKRCKRVFKKFDVDEDGLLKTEEVVNAIHHMFSHTAIEEVELCYIFRILETTSFDIFAEKMNLKLFTIVVSLAEKITQLDKYMKHLIGKVNTEVVDWKIHEAKRFFESTMKRDSTGTFKVPMESMWLELHTGGVTEDHEKQARRALAHMRELDLLDFLTYLPLFLMVHANVVKNPLNQDRYI